jgi:Tfp pilus assembly ATPase PilU
MGMQLMDDEIRRFLELGEITREDAYRYALNKVDFALEPEEGAKKK